MAPIPPPKNDIVLLIDKAHEDKPDRPRPHLGASMLGHACDRWIWLSFRWAAREKFSGRMLRLFRRGHAEEATIMKDLAMTGIDFSKRQANVSFGSHVSGSADAIIEGGVPEAPQTRHIAEFKTHNKKSFDALEKEGVLKAKPEHWGQMQIYMAGTFIERALYVAVCKDDDRYYIERVKFDKEAAEKLIARGKRLALSDEMPPPISTDPTWYQCRFCPAHAMCHEKQPTQHVNCRTCAHSTPKEDSTWKCERFDADGIPFEYQLKGCDAHILHPDMVPWSAKLGDPDEWSVTYTINGKPVVNGGGGFASTEIVANPEGCASNVVSEIKKLWPDAKVVK
jgi:hypothetical protein